jgi:lipopolysaccharide biosynthesis protein
LAQPLHRRVRTGLFYALRTAFRIAPMPEATRDKLRQRFLDRYSDLIPPGPKGQASEGTRVRRPYVRSDERAIGYVPYSKGELPDPLPATLVAFYLPQFHTVPENDAWWGKGFTEWRNVTRALPQFEGHHQPKLPGDLGFYDLRNPEAMREQARLAQEYGISAFCFYFYWFGGKTLLETPLRNWLADPSIDLSFCLCWANEKWTRTWDGRGGEILIDQRHSPEDDLAFIAHVAEYMRDPRYLRVNDKPILLVYRPGLFPEMAETSARWRKWCSENGIGEIHLAYVQSFERPDPHSIGFDAAVEFPPNLSSPPAVTSRQMLINPDYRGQVLDWREMADQFKSHELPNYVLHPGVNCGWDNEARRPEEGRTYLHSSPRAYRDWIHQLLDRRSSQDADGPLIFINAWNEWAEGAILEPDARLGYAYLHQTRKALCESIPSNIDGETTVCVVVHAWYIDVLDEIMCRLVESGMNCRVVITTTHEHAATVRQRMSTVPMQIEVLSFENRGRDILPFLHACERLIDEGVDVVLKLHTKRSTHRADGEQWRRELIESLLEGDRSKVITEAFRDDSKLGIVAPEGHILPMNYYWGANEKAVCHLTARMGLGKIDKELDTFISGSMFWIRLAALRPILDIHLEPSSFESERGQVDGTLAHAIERVFAHCCRETGLNVISTAALFHSEPSTRKAYPYASRSVS